MPILHTAPIDATDAEYMNDGVKGWGPLSDADALALSGYLGARPDTVQRWFNPENPRVLVLNDYVGATICNLGDTFERRRVMLGAMLGDPELWRIGLYTGKHYTKVKGGFTLYDVLKYACDLYDGNLDLLLGFRMSKAWTHMTLAPGAGNPWELLYLYNGLAPEDDSDPDEDCPPEAG
jgi:hypothetical protein